MITKKLMHNIITFCNNYIDNDNIITGITKYPTYIHLNIAIWTLNKDKYIDENKYIDKYIGAINKHIHNEADFNKFKEEIKDELSSLLTKLNTN